MVRMKRPLAFLSIVVLVLVGVVTAQAKLPQDLGFSIAVQLEPESGSERSAFADYLYDLPSGAHWLAGDRSAYHCAYTFLEHNGAIVGRVAFHRVTSAAAYTQINDRYMEEGVRFYDGTLNTDPNLHDTNPAECQEEITYADLAGDPGPLPVIEFIAADATVLETRNYANVDVVGSLSFGIASATTDRVTVVVYQDTTPVAVVYYDRLSPDITLSSNASSPSPSPGPNPGGQIIVPNRVDQGERLKIKVLGCASGDGFNARIHVEVSDNNDLGVASHEVEADDDGTTRVKLRIRKSVYPLGRYRAVVTCIHVFDDGGQSTFFEEDDTFRVGGGGSGR